MVKSPPYTHGGLFSFPDQPPGLAAEFVEACCLLLKQKMIYKIRHTIFTVITLCCVMLFACRTSKVKTQVVEPEEKSAFYTLNLAHDSVKRETKAAITNVTVANLKIRYQPDEAKSKESSFLRIEITYSNDKIVEAFTEHPLRKRFDLYSESGQIESKLISLPQGEVVFRVPYFGAYKKIRIVETIDRKASPPINLKHEK